MSDDFEGFDTDSAWAGPIDPFNPKHIESIQRLNQRALDAALEQRRALMTKAGFTEEQIADHCAQITELVRAKCRENRTTSGGATKNSARCSGRRLTESRRVRAPAGVNGRMFCGN